MMWQKIRDTYKRGEEIRNRTPRKYVAWRELSEEQIENAHNFLDGLIGRNEKALTLPNKKLRLVLTLPFINAYMEQVQTAISRELGCRR